jgi:CSLREA domain-containing protein
MTFTVNSTGDAGDATIDGTCDADATATVQCTLRAAIQEANATTDADTIDFAIPSTVCDATSGVCTISVGST